MAKFTNVTAQVRHIDGIMMIPTVPVEIPDESAQRPAFKTWLESEAVKPGEVEVPAEVEQEAQESADGLPNKAQQQAKSTAERAAANMPKPKQ